MGDLYQTLSEAYRLLYEDLSEGELLELAVSAPVDRRALLAKREKLPETVALFLASDPSIEVRLSLAGRKDLPEGISRLLLLDPSHFVRERIAKRRDMSPEVEFAMAKDGSHFVLWELATNPSIRLCTQKALLSRGMADLEEILLDNAGLHPSVRHFLPKRVGEPFV